MQAILGGEGKSRRVEAKRGVGTVDGHKKWVIGILVLAGSFWAGNLGAIGVAAAQPPRSEYTQLDLNECLVLKADDFEAEFACPGYKGYPVRVVEADLRFYVSFGFGAQNHKAASQTLPPFNRINDTLEWRLRNEEGRFLPFATILGWFTEDQPDAPGEHYLVVTQLPTTTQIDSDSERASSDSCHIGYVNVGVTPNANARAREIADKWGGRFVCGRDTPVRVP